MRRIIIVVCLAAQKLSIIGHLIGGLLSTGEFCSRWHAESLEWHDVLALMKFHAPSAGSCDRR